MRLPPSLVTRASSTIFSIRNRPQPRGFWRPSSFASRSGCLRRWQLAGVPAVGDLHAQPLGRVDHADRDGAVGAVLVAVLHRVHRRLGHRGLQALEARGLEAEVRNRAPRPARSPRARCRARSAARTRRARGRWRLARHPRCRRRAERWSVTIVMSSSCSASGPVKAARSESTWSISSRPPGARAMVSLSRGAPNMSRSGSCASRTPSECSSTLSPGCERGLLLLVGHPRHEAERHAASAQLDDAVGGLDVGKVVAGVREAKQPAARVEHAVEAGHEHLLRHVGAEVLVDALEHLAGLDQALGRSAQHAARGGHDERGRARPCRSRRRSRSRRARPAAGSRRRSRRPPRAPAGRRPRSASRAGRAAPWAGSSAGSAARPRAPARSAGASRPPPPARARAGRPAAPAPPGRRGCRAACGRRRSSPAPTGAGRG